ncbi:DUF4384 domain-containing protein [Deinococcus murrayi]|uniref:DUF4384 domain-containing protein n=1 Tax=Deinococcus murrayi TaxID=68910 RepID=UPI0004895770|nr:DUF4384 domain-containing protein [Deinococcus murrayi]
MRHSITAALTLSALLGTASAQPRLSAQSIIVNPAQPTLDVQVWVNKDASGTRNPVYRVGERISIGVKTNRDAYVYLFNVNASGQIDLFFPNTYEENNLVRANAPRTLPGRNANYTLTVGGPAGQDRLLALASTQPLNLNDVARFVEGENFARVQVRGQDNLARALSIVVRPLPAQSWVTDVVTFRVGTAAQGNGGSATGTVTETPNAAIPVSTAPAPVQPVPVQPAPVQPAPTQPVTQIQPGEKPDGSFDTAMVEAYARLKGPESLGQATSYAVPWGDGLWQKFRGVAAYGDAVMLHANGSSRAYAVHGRVLERYLALAQVENGGIRPPSRLGWAAADEKVVPRNPYGTTGLYALFQNGALYSTEKYGTFWLQGAILKTYQGLGGSGSFLGFPTRDQYLLNGAWAADFEGGSLRTVNGVVKVYRK